MRFALPTCALLLCATVVAGQPYNRTKVQSQDGGILCATWQTRAINYRVDSDGSARTPVEAEFTAIDNAFATWQALSRACSNFQFTRGPRISKPSLGKGTEGDNILTFREENCRDVVPLTDTCQADGSCANKYRCWDGGDGVIALTTSTYSIRTGIIYDSDVEFNAGKALDGSRLLFTTISSPPCVEGKESAFCTATDIQNTATHEIGHMVGLDHVLGSTSTMSVSAPLSDLSKRVIDPGTGAGFCETYPRDAPSPACDDLSVLRRKVVASSIGTPGMTCSTTAGVPWLAVVCGLWRRRKARAAR